MEELKPLSEEEKAAKLVELRTRLLEKRKQQDIENSKDAKKNEVPLLIRSLYEYCMKFIELI